MASSLRWRIAQKTELKWWQNYLKNKDKTAYLNWKQNYWSELLKKVDTILINGGKVPLSSQTNLNILDAGCGPAGVFMALKGHKVQAFDPLLDKYQMNIEHFNQDDYPWVQFENRSLEQFNTDKQYNVVFCMNALNHVQDIEASTKNLKAVLKRGGLFIVTLDTHNYSFFKHLFRTIPGDVLHPHQYSLDEYEGLLKRYKLSVLGKQLLKTGFIFNHWLVVGEDG